MAQGLVGSEILAIAADDAVTPSGTAAIDDTPASTGGPDHGADGPAPAAEPAAVN